MSGTLRAHAVEIFTTNYDLLFEEAFERVRAPYFDGFTGGHSPFFDPVTVAGDDLPARWSRLWKLHGSIGWKLDNGAVVRGHGRAATQLVYPDHLKYDLTQKQPYAALFERLKQFLLTPDTLVLAIGFSFRDAHVCAVLDEALAMNANSAVFAFQFGTLDKEEAACRLAYDRPNLSVYAADGAVISGVAGKWRPGEPPKNWEDIRASFWGARNSGEPPLFLLGDFARFTRFCALAQATELSRPAASEVSSVGGASQAITEDAP
ncbi:SIR2 family NAD-dependent protein deacylase [Hyphomicrobium facile]|uniref:SIR2 family NAD-dependent protein deacylase n=1 Tax=Hyphomicrobium facile TaxID=51670 RepID=UPI001FCDB7E7|nr:SIR2 family protein [Hyphomicrobium facile]